MKSLKLPALALALSAALSPALAADQFIDLSSGQASFDSLAPILDGGDDVLTFTGLAPGPYTFTFTVSSQFITGFSGTLNGAPILIGPFGNISFGGLEGSSTSEEFVVVLSGTPGSRALYSGELTVTLVPEPGTYALLLAGLGVVGFMARRRGQA